MTLTIELPADVEKSLVAQAQAQGVPVDEFVRRFLRDQFSNKPPLSPADRAAAWRELASQFPATPPLSDEAVSREGIYNERG
jgi:hypothetical protein